ncbi:fungal-specific transcription factor domain-containing protein [Bisporella sp. PMI_857]|nr:fungal-specific transcription factor domain-containing protein [Bisporella sp. PMI_857]
MSKLQVSGRFTRFTRFSINSAQGVLSSPKPWCPSFFQSPVTDITTSRLYSKNCQYPPLPKKPKPLRNRLACLEEENRQLQARLGNTPPDAAASSDSIEHPGSAPSRVAGNAGTASPTISTTTNLAQHRAILLPESQTPASAGPSVIGSISQSGYYGRTSALFDDEPSDSRVPRTSHQAAEYTRRQLMGEAAHQRQLETLNYNAGRLDFDGVDPEVGMHLLSLHWNRQHHSHLITYRPAFMRDMACQGPYFSKLLLNAIYFGSCKFSPQAELKGIHTRFRKRVRELLGGALDRSEIVTIQALLVMTNSLFALGDERSAAWIYAGIAFRMLIDLGAHVDGLNAKVSEEDLEIRRRVFWGAFVVDKIQSLYQGRPVSIQEADIKVPILFQDRYEELEHWTPFAYPDTASYPGSPAYSVSTFTELCKLSVIMNAILNNVYGVKSSKRAPTTLTKDLERMQMDLEGWKAALPEHLTFDLSGLNKTVPPPHVLSLHAMYNVLLILLHRPFVSEGHLHSISPSIASNSFSVCAQAASRTVQLLRNYEKTFSIRHAPYLIAYATYVAATIHVRIAAQLGPGSEAYNSLRTCCSVFAKNQDTNSVCYRNIFKHHVRPRSF